MTEVSLSPHHAHLICASDKLPIMTYCSLFKPVYLVDTLYIFMEFTFKPVLLYINISFSKHIQFIYITMKKQPHELRWCLLLNTCFSDIVPIMVSHRASHTLWTTNYFIKEHNSNFIIRGVWTALLVSFAWLHSAFSRSLFVSSTKENHFFAGWQLPVVNMAPPTGLVEQHSDSDSTLKQF